MRGRARNAALALASGIQQFPGVYGSVLTGSVSRDEESFVSVNGRWYLLSDVELMVVARRSAFPHIREYCFQQVRRGGGCVFMNWPACVEVKLLTIDQWLRSSPTVLVFETKKLGIEVGGGRLLERLPLVTAKTLRRGDVFDIAAYRLFALRRDVGAVCFGCEDLTELELARLTVAVARNGLDILTFLLFSAGHLVAGYRNRNELLHSREISPVIGEMPEDFKERMESYLEIKLNVEVRDVNWARREIRWQLEAWTVALSTRLGLRCEANRMGMIPQLRLPSGVGGVRGVLQWLRRQVSTGYWGAESPGKQRARVLDRVIQDLVLFVEHGILCPVTKEAAGEWYRAYGYHGALQ